MRWLSFAFSRNCVLITLRSNSQAFLNRIFVADPAQRATLEELKSHEWLAGDTLPANALYEELLQRKRCA